MSSKPAGLVFTLWGRRSWQGRITTVPETVIISYRGASYAIGQGQMYYGIWPAATPQGQPIEWWQHTPEGWSAAWSRFTSIEVPGTIGPVTGPAMAGSPAMAGYPAAATAAVSAWPVSSASPSGSAPPGGLTATAMPVENAPAGGWQPDGTPAIAAVSPAMAPGRSRLSAGLLGLGIVLGIAGLFPVYLDGASLASVAADVVPHAIYLAAWLLSAGLILSSLPRRQAGALIGLGTSVVTFGLFFADAGTPIAGGAHLMGAGLILSILGWAACTAGAGLACRTVLSARQALRGSTAEPAVPAGYGAPVRRARRLAPHEIVPMVTLVLAAVGAAIAFAPSWDSFTLHAAATGLGQTITEGNAFSNPDVVIVGDVLVMLGFVAVIAMAARWRPDRLGAALAAGAAIPMVAQAISAIVQVNAKATPGQFGISQAQASQIGLTISSGLTAIFWVYCAFLGTLILLTVWMLLTPAAAQDRQLASYPQAGYWQPAWPAPAAAGAVAPAMAGPDRDAASGPVAPAGPADPVNGIVPQS
jgi:hypothetical protein